MFINLTQTKRQAALVRHISYPEFSITLTLKANTVLANS